MTETIIGILQRLEGLKKRKQSLRSQSSQVDKDINHLEEQLSIELHNHYPEKNV